MALHPDFPRSPYEVLPPELRWFPAAEELRSTAYEKLLPPLVAKVREEIKDWRDADYAGASPTSRALSLCGKYSIKEMPAEIPSFSTNQPRNIVTSQKLVQRAGTRSSWKG